MISFHFNFFVKTKMDILKEAFLYLNQLMYEKYLHDKDTKSMEEELMRRFLLMKPIEAKEIVELYCIARKSILRV